MVFDSFFESLRKHYFGFSSDRKIRTIHCSHNYLEGDFEFDIETKSFLLKVTPLPQTCNNTRKYPINSVFLFFPQ